MLRKALSCSRYTGLPSNSGVTQRVTSLGTKKSPAGATDKSRAVTAPFRLRWLENEGELDDCRTGDRSSGPDGRRHRSGVDRRPREARMEVVTIPRSPAHRPAYYTNSMKPSGDSQVEEGIGVHRNRGRRLQLGSDVHRFRQVDLLSHQKVGHAHRFAAPASRTRPVWPCPDGDDPAAFTPASGQELRGHGGQAVIDLDPFERRGSSIRDEFTGRRGNPSENLRLAARAANRKLRSSPMTDRVDCRSLPPALREQVREPIDVDAEPLACDECPALPSAARKPRAVRRTPPVARHVL